MTPVPKEFADSLRAAIGGRAQDVLDALQSEESVVGVRVNPAKMQPSSLASRFGVGAQPVPWRQDAFFLDSRPVFALDPLFHAGAYYVQDPSAMFVGSVADWLISASDAPLRILDLCAAPGGKSTCVAAALRGGDVLVSNEVIGSRASVLAENMVKWGSPNTVVTYNDPKDFAQLTARFDIILADVPCSGEGMFRKDPEALAQWSPDNVNLCAARQRRIVADVWPALREGGWMLYSTCTFNSSENDGNVEWICRELGAEVVTLCGEAELRKSRSIFLQAEYSATRRQKECGAPEGGRFTAEGAVATKYGLQLGMGLTRGEGQYVALLKKTSAQKAKPTPKAAKPARKASCSWLLQGFSAYEVATSAGTILKAYPEKIESDVLLFESALHAIRSGVAVAAVKGRDLIPQADLALSQAFRRDAFPSVELAKDQALDFLRCAALQLPDAPRGFVTVTCENLPLGFVKNLGSRANNLFPQAWRLRM